jgi:imidazolonepropionase-like amidohydrolase
MFRLFFAYSLLFLSTIPIRCFAQFDNLAITNITVFTEPYKPPIEKATILISKGKFKKIGLSETIKIPNAYRVINGEGKYATAGYWNSHVHFIEPKWNDGKNIAKNSLEAHLREMFTSKGFVYVFDLAQIDFENLNALRNRIKNSNVKGPTILSVGVPFTSKSPFYIIPLQLPELKTTEEVRNHVNSQIKNGANGIKIWSASPTGNGIDYLSPPLIQEAARIAASKKIPLFAHPSNLKGVENAVENGVTVLAHVAADDRLVWDSALVQKMITKKVALVPTLKLHFWDLRLAGIKTENNTLITTAINQLATFNKAGGLVLFGTDVGYMNDYEIEEELVQMQKADMSFDQILASLTINPAQKFNLSNKTGVIKVGKNADLVILNKNPASDPRHFSSVGMTIHNGKIIFE